MSDDQVTIKIKQTNNNQTFDVTILKTVSILELKMACAEKSGLSESQQNLVYKGRILADEKFVSDYNIGEGHTIILVKKATQEEKEKSKTSGTTTTGTTGTGSNLNNNNNLPNLFGQGGMGIGGLGGLGGMPDMSSLGGNFGGMDMNTAMNMMSNPQYQQMMSQMLNNPVYLNMILESPQLKPLLDSNPQLRAMFSNPQTLQMLMNPQNLQNAMSMMGGQQGNPLGSLSGTSTLPFSGFNMGGLSGTSGTTGSSGTTETTTGTSTNTNPEQQGSSTTNTSSTNPLLNNPFLMGNPFMFGGNLGNLNNFGGDTNVDPKEKYKEQNEKLKEMGFINDDLNFQILAKTGGNVDAAVERLLNMLH